MYNVYLKTKPEQLRMHINGIKTVILYIIGPLHSLKHLLWNRYNPIFEEESDLPF